MRIAPSRKGLSGGKLVNGFGWLCLQVDPGFLGLMDEWVVAPKSDPDSVKKMNQVHSWVVMSSNKWDRILSPPPSPVPSLPDFLNFELFGKTIRVVNHKCLDFWRLFPANPRVPGSD